MDPLSAISNLLIYISPRTYNKLKSSYIVVCLYHLSSQYIASFISIEILSVFVHYDYPELRTVCGQYIVGSE